MAAERDQPTQETIEFMHAIGSPGRKKIRELLDDRRKLSKIDFGVYCPITRSSFMGMILSTSDTAYDFLGGDADVYGKVCILVTEYVNHENIVYTNEVNRDDVWYAQESMPLPFKLKKPTNQHVSLLLIWLLPCLIF